MRCSLLMKSPPPPYNSIPHPCNTLTQVSNSSLRGLQSQSAVREQYLPDVAGRFGANLDLAFYGVWRHMVIETIGKSW